MVEEKTATRARACRSSASMLLQRYAGRWPGRVSLQSDLMDCDHAFATALTLHGPSGRRYRDAVKVRGRGRLDGDDMFFAAMMNVDALAKRHRRRLKRWLRS